MTLITCGGRENTIVSKSKLIKSGKDSRMLAEYALGNLYISMIPQIICKKSLMMLNSLGSNNHNLKHVVVIWNKNITKDA
mmetsp:Transcript_35249/g.36648  ORF Transcript_35249/g.36648 Transcript_35249/m.36648 type:complete len:80 (-) Transcript_35249:183-422(-)